MFIMEKGAGKGADFAPAGGAERRGFDRRTLKLVAAALILTLFCSLGAAAISPTASAANIISGDSYNNVVAVQTVLKKWGYYTGSVDGVFGAKTRASVRSFQSKNGLYVDGIVGAKTEAAMGLSLTKKSTASSSSSGRNIIKGDTTANVKKVQTVLKNWGYYKGSVDGVFGSGTRTAVRSFQSKNGLYVDGVVGAKTEAAMGISLSGGSTSSSSGGSVSASTSNDLYLLAKCIYAEARGEPYVGQVAVGAVVLNRVKSPSFPNTVNGVIYQPRAFTAVDDGQINLSPDSTAMKAAQDALNGWDPTYGCLYYYNPATATSKWIWSLKVTLTIGKHSFAQGQA